MRDVITELRRASEVATTHKSLATILEHALTELVALDAGMVDGVVVPKPQRDELIAGVAEVADGLFARLKTRPLRAQEWLVSVPVRLRPRCFDLAAWHHELGVPSDETARHAWRRERYQEQLVALLAPVGGDGPTTIAAIEAVFATTLPEPLSVAWGAALAGTAKPKPYLCGTLGKLVSTAIMISDEQLAFQSVAPAPVNKPFPLVPFARARTGDSDYLALEIATGRVVTCRHDIEELGRVWPSVDAWLTRR